MECMYVQFLTCIRTNKMVLFPRVWAEYMRTRF